MTREDELSESISQVLNVDLQDAERIWNEYFPRLMRFAQKRMGSIPRRSFDEEDIALSAMNSFFRGQQAGRFEQLQGDDDIWRLLVTITARKITAERRRATAQKRGGGAVRGESIFGGALGEQSWCEGLAQIMDENQMPESASQIAKTCDALLSQLPDEKLKQTALLRMEGYSNQEISDKLGCSLARTKQRLARVKEIWSQVPGD